MTIEKVFEMSIISVDMKNLAVANALALNAYALQSIDGGENALQRVRGFAGKLPGVERCLLLVSENGNLDVQDLGFDILVVKGEGIGDLLRSLREASSGYDNLFYFFASAPKSSCNIEQIDNKEDNHAPQMDDAVRNSDNMI